MRLQELPNPLPLRLMHDYVQADLIGIPAESFVLTMVERDTGIERKGNGRFRILDPFNGRMDYEFSEDDLQQTGNYDLYVGREDGVAGTVMRYEVTG